MRASQENTNFIIPLVIFHKRVLTVKNICHRKLLFNLYHQIPYGRVSLSLSLIRLQNMYVVVKRRLKEGFRKELAGFILIDI